MLRILVRASGVADGDDATVAIWEDPWIKMLPDGVEPKLATWEDAAMRTRDELGVGEDGAVRDMTASMSGYSASSARSRLSGGVPAGGEDTCEKGEVNGSSLTK